MRPTRTDLQQRLLPIMLAQGFGVLCGIAGVKVASSLVDPEAMGLYGVFLTFTTAGMWIVHVGLIKYVTRHWAASTERPQLFAAIVRSWARKLPWIALLAVVASLAMKRIDVGFGVFAAASLLSLMALAQAALQANREHWRDSGVAMSASLSRTFIPPLVYFASGGIWAGLLFGFVGHTLIAALVGTWMLRKYWISHVSTPATAPQLDPTYTGPFFMTLAIAGWALGGANRWIVAANYGAIEAGYFTLAGNAAIIIPTVLSATSLQFFQPQFFARGDEKNPDRRALARLVDKVAASFGLVALGALLLLDQFAPLLVGPLISPNYADSLKWILPAGCFGIATGTALFYHSMLLAGRRERACGPVDLGSAGVLILGCLITAHFGQDGFRQWLLVTPIIPWLYNRSLARHYLFKPASDQTSATAP